MKCESSKKQDEDEILKKIEYLMEKKFESLEKDLTLKILQNIESLEIKLSETSNMQSDSLKKGLI